VRRSKEVDEDGARIEVAQAGGLDDAAENLLRRGTPLGPISPGDLSIHDGWTKRLLGTPVRGIQREIKQEAEDCREFGREMGGESVAVRQGTGRGKEVQEPRHQMPACDRGAVRGHVTGHDAIANGERVLQHRLDVARPGRPWMRLGDLAAASDQMRETGLMRRLIEPAIRRPAVADEDAVELGAEHGRRFVNPAPVLNGVDDRARRRKDPQPPESSAHLPTGFIGTDDRTAADLVAQRGIGGRRLARGPMERVRHATGPEAHPEPVAQERGDLAVREAEVFIEQHDQRDRVRPEMRARRAECFRRLPRVAPLHAPTTVATPTHVHIEATHMWPHDRQVLLNLRGDARFDQPAAALRTRIGEGDVDPFVNRRRRLPMSMSAVTTTGASSGRTRTGRRGAFRKGRRLSLPRAPRRLERLCQPLNLPPQALALALQPGVLIAEPLAFISRALDLTAQPLQLSLCVLDALRLVAQGHATVMADSRKKYKSKTWITR